MSTASYIGGKGYTVYKTSLTPAQHTEIKKDLTIRPFQGGGGGISNGPVITYPVYRESNTKYYLPRHYGVKTLGNCEVRLPTGNPIDVPFVGELRPVQVPVVESFFENIEKGGSGGLFSLPCAFGKTCLSLNILSRLRLKTLIIVHKTFLLNQWVERIQQFLPTARVGRIQGPILDIDNKDIVIAMLQSISQKEYSESVFSSFGLCIFDEVHHISSEVFSCALFKLVTRYTLGLSATMNRKDGTHHVFKMFLGDILFEGKRDEEHPVIVRVIDYEPSHDPSFEEVETNMQGQVMYSTMISKLCSYTPRTRFLVDVIRHMREEDGDQQIIVLGHNRSLLTELHDATQEFATVGYYVGGMKEASLKESEEKQVIMATYSMAAEALDIKTLTTLIMATPKTEIEQAVGRILRVKHGSPVVVDIVDVHGPFQNQFQKRKTFYKKHNYKMIGTTSKKYMAKDSSSTLWHTIWEPKTSSSSQEPAIKRQKKCMIDMSSFA